MEDFHVYDGEIGLFADATDIATEIGTKEGGVLCFVSFAVRCPRVVEHWPESTIEA